MGESGLHRDHAASRRQLEHDMEHRRDRQAGFGLVGFLPGHTSVKSEGSG